LFLLNDSYRLVISTSPFALSLITSLNIRFILWVL
jgi:hypothetical protein